MLGQLVKSRVRYPLEVRKRIANEVILGIKGNMEACRDYGIPKGTLRRWVEKYRKEMFHQNGTLSLPMMKKVKEPQPNDSESKLLSQEKRIKELEKQLFESKLRNQALNIMIDLAEKHYGIRVRKNSGAKQ
jgi:transposase-like protein